MNSNNDDERQQKKEEETNNATTTTTNNSLLEKILNNKNYNIINDENKNKEKEKLFSEIFTIHYSPFLLIAFMILMVYASYILITNSKIFMAFYIIFILGILFIPVIGEKIWTHIKYCIDIYYYLIENVSFIRYDVKNDSWFYGSTTNNDNAEKLRFYKNMLCSEK